MRLYNTGMYLIGVNLMLCSNDFMYREFVNKNIWVKQIAN